MVVEKSFDCLFDGWFVCLLACLHSYRDELIFCIHNMFTHKQNAAVMVMKLETLIVS